MKIISVIPNAIYIFFAQLKNYLLIAVSVYIEVCIYFRCNFQELVLSGDKSAWAIENRYLS